MKNDPRSAKEATQHSADENDDDFPEEVCIGEGCGASLDDGEGYDGYCGNCADRREPLSADEDDDDASLTSRVKHKYIIVLGAASQGELPSRTAFAEFNAETATEAVSTALTEMGKRVAEFDWQGHKADTHPDGPDVAPEALIVGFTVERQDEEGTDEGWSLQGNLRVGDLLKSGKQKMSMDTMELVAQIVDVNAKNAYDSHQTLVDIANDDRRRMAVTLIDLVKAVDSHAEKLAGAGLTMLNQDLILAVNKAEIAIEAAQRLLEVDDQEEVQ